MEAELRQYIMPNSVSTSTTHSIASKLKKNQDLEEHLVWFQEQRQAAVNFTTEQEGPLKLYYRSMAGIGHQLTRMAAAYHLSKVFQIPRIYVTANPVCGSGDIFTIYNYLIGQGPIIVDLPFSNIKEVKVPHFPNYTIIDPSTMSNESLDSLNCCAYFNSDVPGYGAHIRMVKDFHQKDSTDYEFYQQIMMLFKNKHKERVEEVLSSIKFDEHTVFGLHVRAGNGEKKMFTARNRGINDLDNWIDNVIQLLCSYSETHQDYFVEKPLMLFVGTDTGSVVQKLQNASSRTCKIPVVSNPQEYPSEGEGVTCSKQYDDIDKCLKSWQSMFLDMYIFTLCNSVIAGQYSSFTQAAPLSFVFHKAKMMNAALKGTHPHYFCEVGVSGEGMECFDDLRKWILRLDKREALGLDGLDYDYETVFFGNHTSFERHTRHLEIQFPLPGQQTFRVFSPFDGTALIRHNFTG